jgi:hypothetical protein
VKRPYLVTVFFNGPETVWTGEAQPRHFIYQIEVPWRWLARVHARQQLGNMGRCGFQIARDGKVIDEFLPDEAATA